MTNDVNEFLMSGGVTSAKFEQIGDTLKGVIEAAEVRAQTDIKTGEVKTYRDGNVMKQLVLTIQSDQYDDDEDDGMRRVFVKGQMAQMLREAVRNAGVKGIANGGKVGVKFVSELAPDTRGFSPTKQYQVYYVPPAAPEVSMDEAFGEEEGPPPDAWDDPSDAPF